MLDAFPIQIPAGAAFPRLDEYCGVWLVDSLRFVSQCRIAARMSWDDHKPTEQKLAVNMLPGRDGMSIAEIPVTGLLMKQKSSMGGTSTIELRREIRSAAGDPNVSGILLRIDSPGGTAAGMADLAGEVRMARRRKPIYSQVEDLGASAAYWLASQTDQIFANNALTQVGSIGTYQVVYDYSAAAEKDGVKTFLFTTGPLKGMATPGTALTEEQQAHLQEMVDNIQSHFDAAVKSGRSLSADQLKAARTGATFPASRALGMRLIDGIQGPEKTYSALAAAK